MLDKKDKINTASHTSSTIVRSLTVFLKNRIAKYPSKSETQSFFQHLGYFAQCLVSIESTSVSVKDNTGNFEIVFSLTHNWIISGMKKYTWYPFIQQL